MIFQSKKARLKKLTEQVLALEGTMSQMSNTELRNMTQSFKRQLSEGRPLDTVLPAAYAVVREAAWRVLGKKPYPVQVAGAIALHWGTVTQMATGEGKAIPVSTSMPTPDGWRKAGEIAVGDRLFGRKGEPVTVTGVYPQGEKPVYEVEFEDGRIIQCNHEHLWSVYTSRNPLQLQTVKTSSISSGLRKGELYAVPLCQPAQFPSRRFRIPTSDYARKLIEAPESVSRTALTRYLSCAVVQRRKFLRAMIDERGSLSYDPQQGCPYILLRCDCPMQREVALLQAYSLGCKAMSYRSREDDREIYVAAIYPNKKEWGKIFQTSALKEEALQMLVGFPGKAEEGERRVEKDTGTDRLRIVDVRKLPQPAVQVCFKVDSADHLFLAGDYIVTHNTLTATMPAYLNALEDKGVHVVTVNDYLARRDAAEMGKVYAFLGLKTSVIEPHMPFQAKKEAYLCDITYGTNKEFGFDYLRDNMAPSRQAQVQRPLHYAIIDEVDSILIDDARTPLIIAGSTDGSQELYMAADRAVKALRRGRDKVDRTKIEEIADRLEAAEPTREELEEIGDYTVDEKGNTVILTDRGVSKVEHMFGIASLGSAENTLLSHRIQQALRANALMKRDVDYLVKNNTVQIVDASTGRVLDGRRFSDGLHQAIEAKEGVPIQQETTTEATCSLQNYFRLYDKISGMTGTGMTEKKEFREIYGMDVVEIPTNLPVIRKDEKDRIFLNGDDKYKAVLEDIRLRHEKGQPILAGTPSIEESEKLSRYLKKNGIPHVVLNAKNDEKEAEIVARAGLPGMVTIATNMAGRGTDILLGGNPEFEAMIELRKEGLEDSQIAAAMSMLDEEDEQIRTLRNHYKQIYAKKKEECARRAETVRQAGGLHVLGTTRHDSRRVDNQLRGRAGRQGDPGSSQFFAAMDDDTIRPFTTEKVRSMMQQIKDEEDEPAEFDILAKAVNSAQKQREIAGFEARKATLEYDDVNNVQRQRIYALREQILNGQTQQVVESVLKSLAQIAAERFLDARADETQIEQLKAYLEEFLPGVSIVKPGMRRKEALQAMEQAFQAEMEDKKKSLEQLGLPQSYLSEAQQNIMLAVIDRCWKSYITALENLRDEVRMKGFGRDKPVDIYKRDAARMFASLQDTINEESGRMILSIRFKIMARTDTGPRVVDQQIEKAKIARPSVKKAGEGLTNDQLPDAALMASKTRQDKPVGY